ncbi:hydrogenase iron-sulfur subunit [[Eubacterium] cellulosolvens]
MVLAFSCNWCSYTSADLAGINRFFYPANVRVIRFMCSGRIEPEFIMEAFEYGADGVIVSGCKLGECHYISGNEKAQKRLEMTGKLLDLLGIGSERLGSVWISAAEGAKFADYMNEFVDKIRKLGPSPAKREC